MIDKVLLQQALAGLQRAQSASAGKDVREAVTLRGPVEAAPSPADEAARAAAFEQRVRQGIRGIGPDDPQRRRRALRVLIEISLLQEFGEQISSDPAFHAIVDQVACTLDDDPALADTIKLALDGFTPPRIAL
jgi:hypothetical protein